MLKNKDLTIGQEVMQIRDFSALSRLARRRLIDMHYDAGVGHLGGNLSALDAMLYLHHEVMDEQDIFVLSKGHAAGAFYITLWTLGSLADGDLRTFHADGTVLSGHPAANIFDRIRVATGSLGHGFPISCGLALARKLAKRSGNIYCICSDGEWQEGSNWEALIFAIHHQLENLILLIDDNGLQGFGSTADIASMGTFSQLFSGFDVDINELDGHSAESLEQIKFRSENRLTVFDLHTVKGKGISFMENRLEWHYLSLSREQYERAIVELGT